MVDMWIAGPDEKEMLVGLIREFHHELVEIIDEIIIIMKEKPSNLDANPGYICHGVVKKAPPIMDLIVESQSGVGVKFIFEISSSSWQSFGYKQRVALMDHLLCSCKAVETKSGDVRYTTVKPEIQMFKDEIRRHGVWIDTPSSDDTKVVDILESVMCQEE